MMKIIHVPFNSKIKEALSLIIMSISMTSLSIAVLAILKLDFIVFIILTIIGYLSGLLVWKVMTMEILIWTTDFVKIRIITEINNFGFTVHFNSKSTLHKWRDIKSVCLLEGDKIMIKKKYGKEVILGREYTRWFELLKRTPKNLLMDDEIPTFIEALSNRLETCPICGKISLDASLCLYCNGETYNEQLSNEDKNKKKYIRTKQFELFCTDHKMEKVNFKLEENDGFDLDESWQPLVTVKEVIEYSRENEW